MVVNVVPFTVGVRLPALAKPLSALAAVALLAGCASFKPHALQPEEVKARVEADRVLLERDVEPVSGVLSLEEAIARAIKYNAGQRLKAMEQALAQGTLDVAKFDMLPDLVASAGYRYRDKDLITRSIDSVTGAPSLANPYVSSDRTSTLSSLGFSWSLLDFGQSYYAARQHADRSLIAEERRRKALHTLIQDVRTAYWRVAASQALRDTLRATVTQGEAALADARQVEAEKLRPPVEPLRYQRQLLENLRLLEAIEQDLASGRIELATLIGLPPSLVTQPLRVAEPAIGTDKHWLELPVEQLEERALMLNPDLRESLYQARIARDETKRVMTRMFPGVSFNYGLNRSNDSYLINDSWRDAGVQVSFNLFGLLALPAQRRLADAGVALADQKRMATQMAVLTQLHIARLQFANAMHQYERSDAISEVDQRITQHVGNQVLAEKATMLEGVAQQTASILSILRRYQALANMQEASSRLQATLGMEPVIEGSDTMPLPELTAAVAQALRRWDAGEMQ